MTPGDFDHCDGLVLDDSSTFSISLVRLKGTGQLFVEVLHGDAEERYLYAPVDVDPARVDSIDDLAAVMGTEAGR